MPQPAKGPRLYLVDRAGRQPVYVIRDTAEKDRSTGTSDRASAERALAAYIAAPKTEAARRAAVLRAVRGIGLAFFRGALRKCKERANARGLPCDLTTESLQDLMADQQARCALTGYSFDFSPSETGRRKPFAPSVDRIDGQRGYVGGNVRWVCVIANLARGDFSDEEFRAMCIAVAENTPESTRTCSLLQDSATKGGEGGV